jgi:hypothetical protein
MVRGEVFPRPVPHLDRAAVPSGIIAYCQQMNSIKSNQASELSSPCLVSFCQPLNGTVSCQDFLNGTVAGSHYVNLLDGYRIINDDFSPEFGAGTTIS